MATHGMVSQETINELKKKMEMEYLEAIYNMKQIYSELDKIEDCISFLDSSVWDTESGKEERKKIIMLKDEMLTYCTKAKEFLDELNMDDVTIGFYEVERKIGPGGLYE